MGSASQRGGLRRLVLRSACALISIAAAGGSLAGLGVSSASAAPLTWSPSPARALSASGPLHLSCASTALCVAVDAKGEALVSGDPGAANASWTPLEIDSGHALTGISCPSASLCVAVDDAGAALVSTEPATAKWTPLAIDAGHGLTGVSCPMTTLCVAVDDAGDVLSSTTPITGGWTSPQAIDGANALRAVSCSSASLCVAVDEVGNALASGVPAAGKPWASQPIAYEGTPLLAISCGTDGACTALDKQGYALTSSDPAVQSTGPGTLGPTWSATLIDTSSPLIDVSCLPGLCVAIDEAGNSLASESAFAMPYEWSASLVGIGAGTSLDSLSCIPASFCVAVAAPSSAEGHFQAFTAPVPQPSLPPPGKTPPPSLPVLNPTLSGTPAVGQTLTCEPGLAAGTVATVTYQWTTNTKTIAGATHPKLKLKGRYEGDHVRCSVTATNAAGSVTKATSYVSIPREVAPAAVGETEVTKAVARKSGVSFTVQCSPRAVGRCTIEAKLSVFERLRGTKVIAVYARRPSAAHARHARTAHARRARTAHAVRTRIARGRRAHAAYPRRTRMAHTRRAQAVRWRGARDAHAPRARQSVTGAKGSHSRVRTATIGFLKLQVKPGHDRKMNVPLNAAGRKLLSGRRSLPARLTISGTVIGVLKSKLSEARVTLRAPARTGSGHAARSTGRHHSLRT